MDLFLRRLYFFMYFTDFHEILYLRIFLKSVEKIQFSLKLDKNKMHFTWRPTYIFLSYLTRFFGEWELFRTKFVEKITKHISYSVIVFKNPPCVRKCGKILYSGAGHRIQYGAYALHAGYQRHTYSLSTASVFAWTRLNVTSTYMTCRV
jgi:hypothetical protein